MILSTIKKYFIAAAIVFAFISGVTITYWYYKAKKVSALESVIKTSNIQVGKDEKIETKASNTKVSIKSKFKSLNKKVYHVKTKCTYPAGSEFVRLWNKSNKRAGTKKAN